MLVRCDVLAGRVGYLRFRCASCVLQLVTCELSVGAPFIRNACHVQRTLPWRHTLAARVECWYLRGSSCVLTWTRCDFKMNATIYQKRMPCSVYFTATLYTCSASRVLVFTRCKLCFNLNEMSFQCERHYLTGKHPMFSVLYCDVIYLQCESSAGIYAVQAVF